ncbi:PQ-loop-domain-containing protein [Fomitiporia mediterranea MF3/22]|uniref:PQ-loop-domain-containing protein n=1 Tax=Fomitiporia mediterranea (strain MF3/22) TaxID=694068 RepID=UPI0004409395|nr:PQ-loop-domain-containing protein [Fomitiporia mediterranea MF3/22]EJC98486.1 PQ-loop-domain-containing protein [Fomitiporia mediterranea MF3/22]
MGNEELSSAFGWVSIACWIVVYSPQIWENYQLQSGEGLSVAFVVVWLLGDLCNLVGASMAGLQATVIIIAIYYSLCDVILLVQIYYYRYKSRARRIVPAPRVVLHTEDRERAPLLGSRVYEDDCTSQKTTASTAGEGKNEDKWYGRAALRYLLALLFVFGVGTAAWGISWRYGVGVGDGGGGGHEGAGAGRGAGPAREKDVIEWRSQVIGWTSAVLYLGSRIPQILKNTKTRCEGLSLALFMFSIAGNVTYVLSICTASMGARHLIANASWLAGSGLTVFLDVFVLCQFFYFRREDAGYLRAEMPE